MNDTKAMRLSLAKHMLTLLPENYPEGVTPEQLSNSPAYFAIAEWYRKETKKDQLVLKSTRELLQETLNLSKELLDDHRQLLIQYKELINLVY